jgi:hypothetical protein
MTFLESVLHVLVFAFVIAVILGEAMRYGRSEIAILQMPLDMVGRVFRRMAKTVVKALWAAVRWGLTGLWQRLQRW